MKFHEIVQSTVEKIAFSEQVVGLLDKIICRVSLVETGGSCVKKREREELSHAHSFSYQASLKMVIWTAVSLDEQ